MTSTGDEKIWTGALWEAITNDDEGLVCVEEVVRCASQMPDGAYDIITFHEYPYTDTPVWGLPRDEFEARFRFTGATR